MLNAEADRKHQFDLMEQSYNDLVLANAIREEDEAAQRAAEEKIRETQERLRREREATENVISVTTKRCPNCGEGTTHWHGHGCHHIMPGGGCPTCHQHFCFACEQESRQRDRWSSPCSCAPFCNDANITQHIGVRAGYRFDTRCGCLFCNECKPGRPCESCTVHGGCAVCQGLVEPNNL